MRKMPILSEPQQIWGLPAATAKPPLTNRLDIVTLNAQQRNLSPQTTGIDLGKVSGHDTSSTWP